MNAGVPGLGTSSHIAMELLMQVTGTKFAAIPYRGTPPLADLLSGQIDVAITPTIAYIALINEGALRPLAVTSLERSAQAPSVPDRARAGLQGFRGDHVVRPHGADGDAACDHRSRQRDHQRLPQE